MFKKAVVSISISLAVAGTAFATEDGQSREISSIQNVEARADADQEIPEQVAANHWSYKATMELAEKFGAEKKLPEGRSCSREEMVEVLISVMSKVAERYDKEGSQAVAQDDLENIRALIVALENELFKRDGYRQIRRTVEQLLVQVEPPGVPYYRYRLGVNGFLRGEGQSNFDIAEASYTPGEDEARFLYRVQPFVYWHPNNWLDMHLEGQGYGYAGGNDTLNKLSLYQGFVEAKLPREDVPGKNWFALKAGRQEFNYGSGFVLGADSFFNGLSFDAVRLRVQPALPWLNYLTIDLLGGSYVSRFSDGVKGDLAGAYLTYEPEEGNTLEAYAFRDTGYEERNSGEHLNTVGFRSSSSVGIFGLEYEAVYQTGKIFNETSGVNDKISAFGGHIDLTGEFKIANRDHSVFMSYALGSGDQNAADGVRSNKEFRNSNNDSSLVGDMGVVGDLSGLDVAGEHASGMQVYTLGWGMDFPVGTANDSKLNISATGRKFVAGDVRDGLSRNVGVEADLTLTYIMNKDYALIVGYDRFFTGKFFKDATGSGKDIDYGYAMLVFNYDWTKRIPLKR